MQRAPSISSSVACPALQYFSTLSHKRHDFRKKNGIELKMCVLIFSTNLSETFLILRRTERHMIKMYVGLHVKYPLFLFSLMLLEFTHSFLKNTQI